MGWAGRDGWLPRPPTARHDDSKEPGDDPSQLAVGRAVEPLSRDTESTYLPAVPPEEAATTRFPVEDGEVLARLDSTELSDAAADALWRIVEKSTRRKRSR
jgi:hypothetical protein